MSIAWSFSRIKKYRQCQLKSFYMDYAPKAMKIKEPPNPIFEKGERMHKALENAVRDGVPLPADLDVGQGEKMDLRHLQGIVDIIRQFPHVFIEEQRSLDKDLRQVDWFSKETWCRVIWDVAAISDDGKRGICVDWKSGKPRPDSDQLELFGASMMAMFPSLEEVWVGYVFAEKRKYSWECVKKKDERHIWQKFGEEANMIAMSSETGNWEPCPGNHCRWCPVPKSCCSYSEVDG